MAALTVWTALSAHWSDHPATSTLEAERTLVYLAAMAAVLLSVERSSLLYLLGGALAGVTVVSSYGLGTYVIFGPKQNPIEGRLLFEPLGYANGLGAYAAIGLLLASGLALGSRRWLVRAACLVSAAILGPTMLLTSSRAAELALAAGVVVLLLFGRRGSPAFTALLAGAAAVALGAAVLATAQHGLVSQLAGENRPRYWHVAWREYTENRILGSGAGTFDEYWLRYRTVSAFARDAHSLYLETLAELGPVGLALLLLALGLPLLALRHGRDPLRATAAAGYVAYLIHAGLDWDWELPAVTISGLLCGTALLVAAREDGAPELSGRARAVLLVPALGLAVLALIRLRTGPPLPFGP
jgi:O-antigen ligase